MESATKSIIASKTVWGIVIAAAGVIAESGDMLGNLIGVEWADKVVIVAGLVIAFWGRMSASKGLTLLPCLLAVLMAGCSPGAGNTAREGLLSPWAQQAWPSIRTYAERGISDMVDDGELTDQTAAFPRETVRLFGESVDALGGGR